MAKRKSALLPALPFCSWLIWCPWLLDVFRSLHLGYWLYIAYLLFFCLPLSALECLRFLLCCFSFLCAEDEASFSLAVGRISRCMPAWMLADPVSSLSKLLGGSVLTQTYKLCSPRCSWTSSLWKLDLSERSSCVLVKTPVEANVSACTRLWWSAVCVRPDPVPYQCLYSCGSSICLQTRRDGSCVCFFFLPFKTCLFFVWFSNTTFSSAVLHYHRDAKP